MIDAKYRTNGSGSVVDVLGELKDDAVEFLATRAQMFVSEMHENYDSSKKALIYGSLAFVLLATGYLLITLATVALIAVAFLNNPYAWFFACLIVGLSWLIFGAICAAIARANFRGLTPKRTLKLLKEDKSVLQSPSRSPA